MSLIKALRAQLGMSGTPTQNFTLTAEAADGSMKLARGNAGATTQDILTVDAAGKVAFPAGATGVVSAGTSLTQNPYAAGATVTQAHGLSVRPQILDAYLECVTADLGYSVGDKVTLQAGVIGGGATAFVMYADATNVYLNTTSGVTPAIPHKTSHTNTGITVANWKVVATPYKVA